MWIPCELEHKDDRSILALVGMAAIAVGHSRSICQEVKAESHAAVLGSVVGLEAGARPTNVRLPAECLACDACVVEWRSQYASRNFADLEDVAESQDKPGGGAPAEVE